ncbi:MAG: hypothetical protein K0S53_2588 [Bacteroidetes bacterium]|jgi:hypothetical protein|nr:hypothetical protein [Bacteroidota bacterium]MDF2450972.1 hypothetical protein [Bacteroidota bacterium]
MKKNSLFLLLFFISKFTLAQCTGGSNGGAISPAPTATYQTMNLPAGDFYYTFVVAVSTCFPQYDFSFCSADGSNATYDTQITILDNSGSAVSGGYSDDYCSTQSHVTWTPTLAGTYRVHINKYNCISTSVSTTLAYKSTTTYTNTAEYTVNGNATSTGSCTTVTPNSANQRGCVWDVNSTLNFLSPFTYNFTVNLGSSDAGADGIAFVIQNDAKGRCACGTAGGSLGAGGITNSLIVEIDTYLNTEDRDDFNTSFIGCGGAEDPDHMDLWFNGVVNPDLDANCNATAAGERPVTTTAVRLQNPPGTNYNIENGANHILSVNWTPGSPGTFTARILNTALTTTYATISTTLNPITIFGTNTPFFGFTASTGGLSNQQTICNPSILLPVELLHFNASCNANEIIVNWATASEINNKLFELERSTDGLHFIKIASFPGHGSSINQQMYSYKDIAIDKTIYYYRLKQIDYDNHAKIIGLITSAGNSCYDEANAIVVFPNPANDGLYIKMEAELPVLIEIINDCGQIVYTSYEKLNDQKTIQIKTSSFATGVYAVRIINNDKPFIKKILINH